MISGCRMNMYFNIWLIDLELTYLCRFDVCCPFSLLSAVLALLVFAVFAVLASHFSLCNYSKAYPISIVTLTGRFFIKDYSCSSLLTYHIWFWIKEQCMHGLKI